MQKALLPSTDCISYIVLLSLLFLKFQIEEAIFFVTDEYHAYDIDILL